MLRRTFSFLILLLFVTPAACSEYDFTVEVPPGKFQCFFQPIYNSKYKTLEIDYQVIDGGDLNINFMVLNGADVLVQEHMKTDGSHKIDIKDHGDYQLCFDNTFSYQSRKVVFFEIFLFDADGNLDDLDIAKYANEDKLLRERLESIGVTLSEFHATANRIKGSLNKIEYHQALLRAYEARDRSIMNANLERVSFWSVLNAVIMVAVGGVQVYMIRSLFEEDSKIGKILRKT
uniref:GOLD domain-containing protein n=1 Tax=Steinernema glaseri TaxID=37863 RepID=A0A1I7Z8S5_9BILA